MFKFWGSQEQQADQRPQEVSTNSWYGSPIVSSPSPSRPTPPNTSNSNVSPSEATDITVYLKDKSVDELKILLSDKQAYEQFLLSTGLVRNLNNLRDDLRNETLQLARENLAKESSMTELQNQCMIIRTTELASAQEKLNDLNKQKVEILKSCSQASLLHQLQDSVNGIDEESETLHKQLLEKEIDLATFIPMYKKLRMAYHKHALTHLVAKTLVLG